MRLATLLKSWALAALYSIYLSTSVEAEPIAKDFIEKYPKNTTDIVYVMGILSGFTWVNGYLEQNKVPRLYCQGDQHVISDREAVEIVRSYITDSPIGEAEGFYALPMVMLDSLREKFPCSSK